MKDVVHITGHKNPDTDSIAASIALAELKNKQGINAIACRIGDINPETDFVLKKFNVEEPKFIANAKVKLYDVPFDEPSFVHPDCTIKEAWEKIIWNGTSALYIVDQDEKLIGVASMSDISSILLNDKGPGNKQLMSQTKTDNIVRVLEGKYLYKAPKFRTTGDVHVLGGKMTQYADINFKDSIVVMSDDLKLQKYVIQEGASCIVLVDVDIVSNSMLELAKAKNTTIIQSDLNMLCTIRRLFKSPSVSLIMKRNLIGFNKHQYIDDVSTKMSKTRYRSYPVVNNKGVLIGSITRYHLLNYQKKRFILVDHNELSQSVDFLKEAEVLEVVDHHRIGDVQTKTPIRFRNEIIGSTCSIIAKMYQEAGIQPEKSTAALMCCAIISDTMNFNSPTTTADDKIIAEGLADWAGINLDEIAKEMFGAVATLKGRSVSEILYNDFKEYNIDGKRIAIGQINVADSQEILNVKDEFMSYLKKINSVNKFDLLMMCFTSAEGTGSNLVFVGELSDIVDETFKDYIEDDLYFVDGIISRKKQIVPMLSKTLSEL